MALGVLAIGAGLLADVFGGRGRGIGTNQWLLCTAGLALIAIGFAAAPAQGGLRSAARLAWGRAPRLGLMGGIALAAWFGLLNGVIEAVHELIRHLGFGARYGRPLHALWLMPLTYVVLYLPAGVAIGLAATLLPRWVVAHAAVVPLGALLLWTQLRIYTVLDPGVSLFLSLVLSVQLARGAAGAPLGFAKLRRWSGIAMVAAAALAAAVLFWRERDQEQDALAALAEATPATPNVLLLVLDTVRADHLSAYGHERATTPNLDALAQRGVLFERFASTSPWTLPAHATMFTGTYGFEHGADYLDPLDEALPTLAEVLRDRGYATGGFVGNLSYCRAEWGLDRGFTRYIDFKINVPTALFSTVLGRELFKPASFFWAVRNSAGTLVDETLAWVDGPAADRPFFAFLNFFDAHSRYFPPPPHDAEFGPPTPHIDDWFRKKWVGDELQGFVRLYDGCIHYIDAEIGRLLGELQTRGQLENTLVVLTGDHGEHWGEHGLLEHGNSLYMPLLHEPLILALPGQVPEGVRVSDWTSMRDLPATMLELLGLGGPTPPLPGRSLVPSWADDKPPADRSPMLSEVSKAIRRSGLDLTRKGDMQSLIEDDWHLIINGDGALQLFHLGEDPGEENDLADTERGRPIAQRMQRAVTELLGQ